MDPKPASIRSTISWVSHRLALSVVCRQVSTSDDDIEDMDEKSFEALEDNVDRLATEDERVLEANPGPDLPANVPIHSEADFEAAVRAALDALPAEVEDQLRGMRDHRLR